MGIHLKTAAATLGNAPASHAQNRNRTISIDPATGVAACAWSITVTNHWTEAGLSEETTAGCRRCRWCRQYVKV